MLFLGNLVPSRVIWNLLSKVRVADYPKMLEWGIWANSCRPMLTVPLGAKAVLVLRQEWGGDKSLEQLAYCVAGTDRQSAGRRPVCLLGYPEQ